MMVHFGDEVYKNTCGNGPVKPILHTENGQFGTTFG